MALIPVIKIASRPIQPASVNYVNHLLYSANNNERIYLRTHELKPRPISISKGKSNSDAAHEHNMI